MNPLVVAALIPAVWAIPWRLRPPVRSRDEARRILACTIAPAAVYFLLHSLHDRVQGNWLAPLYPAAAILAADWVAETRRAGAAGFAGAIAKAAPWAAPIGLAVAALTFAEAMTSAIPLGPGSPLARLEGFQGARARSRRQGARRERALCPDPRLRADFADDLLRRSGDPHRAAAAAHALDIRASAVRNAVRSAWARARRTGPPFRPHSEDAFS